MTRRRKLDRFRIIQLVKQITVLKEKGFTIVFVISGAVVCGNDILRTDEVEDRCAQQLAAGVGQAYLTSELYKIFMDHGFVLAQMLLTKGDLEDRNRQEALKNIMRLAVRTNIVPVLNENDLLELHSFGGNDFLAGKIAQLLHADSLLLLTDVDGVYSENQQIVRTIDAGKSKPILLDKRECPNGRVGGMEGKIEAAKTTAGSGIPTVIANGKIKNIVARLTLNQEKLGTRVIR